MSTPAGDLRDTTYSETTTETTYGETGLGRTPRRGRIATREIESVPGLLRRLADEVTTLFAQELALLKSETTTAVNDVKTGIVSVATGGAVAFLGAIFLLLAAVYGLSEVVQPWLAALIVGGVVTLIGLIMLMTGKKKVEPSALRPRHTEAALRKDANMIKGATP
jgi:hypothetical protein